MKTMKSLMFCSSLLFFTGCNGLTELQSVLPGGFGSGSAASSGNVVIIQATATDNVGVTKVEFYVDNALICTVTAPPYNCPWTVPPVAGVGYTLQTKAYDFYGKVGVSAIVNVSSR